MGRLLGYDDSNYEEEGMKMRLWEKIKQFCHNLGDAAEKIGSKQVDITDAFRDRGQEEAIRLLREIANWPPWPNRNKAGPL